MTVLSRVGRCVILYMFMQLELQTVSVLLPQKCHLIKLLHAESNTANPIASSDAGQPAHTVMITARRANTPAGTAQRQCDALVLTHTNT